MLQQDSKEDSRTFPKIDAVYQHQNFCVRIRKEHPTYITNLRGLGQSYKATYNLV